jgi:hypothetical protein
MQTPFMLYGFVDLHSVHFPASVEEQDEQSDEQSKHKPDVSKLDVEHPDVHFFTWYT